MLTRLTISNFRCFRELDVPLKPLTVLIGPNDTGKSTFLDSIVRLGPSGKINKGDACSWPRPGIVECSVHGNSGCAVEYKILAREQESGQWGNYRSDPLEGVFRFQLPVVGISTECDGYDREDSSLLSLDTDGSRVAAMLDHLLRTDLDRYLQIRDGMRELVPGFVDLKIDTPQKQRRKVDFIIENGLRLPADKTSAGVRLLLFFMALAHHPSPPSIILLEEPETGLHPKRLADVVKLLRNITQGMHGGHAAQVILTTHSPYLLDCVDPEQDQVLVFQRLSDGSRTAMPIDAARIKEHFDGFLLGEVWFNEEEAGLIARGAE